MPISPYRFLQYVFLATVILTPLAFLGWFSYAGYKTITGKKFFNQIKDYPQYYCRDTFRQALNPAIYIEDAKESGKALEIYYDSVQKGYNPPYHFPINYLPEFKRIYIIRHPFNDSLLSEFYDFDTTCYGYVHGYVYSKTLYKGLPSNRLMIQMDPSWDTSRSAADYVPENVIHSSSNSWYGSWCGCGSLFK